MVKNRVYLLFLFLSHCAVAQELVKDINTRSAGQEMSDCTVCGGITFFIAEDVIHGKELWKTDGSPAGTQLVKDISPGPQNGLFTNRLPVCLNNKLYFSTGSGIWKSDGTEEGTIPVLPGGIDDIQIFKGTLIYVSDRSLIQSNGEPENAETVLTINAPLGQRLQMFAMAANNIIYLAVTRVSETTGGLSGHDVWAFTGTTATKVKTFTTGELIMQATINDRLIFTARDDDHGNEYWVSDGTIVGTQILLETSAGAAGSFPGKAFEIGGTVLLTVEEPNAATWKTDGTIANTTLVAGGHYTKAATVANSKLYLAGSNLGGSFIVKKLNLDFTGAINIPIGDFGDFQFFGVADNKLLCSSWSNDYGYELFSIDLVSDQYALLKDINEGPSDSNPRSAATAGGSIVFMANDNVHGNELWKSDGTLTGTTLVKDIADNTEDAANGYIYRYNDRMYFLATDASGSSQLWESDGTTEATEPINETLIGPAIALVGNQIVSLRDDWKAVKINLDSRLTSVIADPGQSFGFFSPSKTATAGDNAYFYLQGLIQPGDVFTGMEIWRANPVTDEFGILKDIEPGAGSSSPFSDIRGAAVNGKLVFSATNFNDTEPWITDGSEVGTVQLKNIVPGGSSHPDFFTPLGDRVIFFANTPDGSEVWATDGTTNGTILLDQTNAANPQQLATLNDKAFFSVYTDNDGPNLWTTDGTPGGTSLLKKIPVQNSSITDLMNTDDRIYFIVNGFQSDLWTSDGTIQGTRKVDYDFGEFVDVEYYTFVGSKLIFSSGGKIYSTLGTKETTTVLGTAQPKSELYAIGDHVYFLMDHPQYGRELFRIELGPAQAPQEISVSGLEDVKFGNTYTITFSATSGLPVSVESSDPTTAEIDDDQLIIHKTGSVTFAFSQAGSASFQPVTKSVEVEIGKGDQIITIEPIGPINFESEFFAVEAETSSDLPLTYTTDENTVGKVTLEENFATIVERGRVIITVSQEGNSNFNPAEPVSQTICLNPEHPTITQSTDGSVITLTSSATINVWQFNDEEILVPTTQSIQPTENGIYRAAAVVDECQGAFSNPMPVVVMGLEELSDSMEFFPNPAKDILFMKSPAQLRIIDVRGREVFNQYVTENVDVSSLSPGFYIAIANNKQYKFMIQR